MLKRNAFLALLIAIAVLFSMSMSLPSDVSAEPPAQSTPTPGGIQIEPENPTPTPLVPTLKPPDDAFGGTPPSFRPPPTLDELIAQFPDLAPYIEQVRQLDLGDLDLAELYRRIFQIYDARGATGVATFLKDSGILEKLNIPLSYLDLLIAFDQGGLEAVEELARTRRLINDEDELVAYLLVDDPANVETLRQDLEENFGVSYYGFDPTTEEVEIGIPLALLAQYQTPGSLLGYLVALGNAEHVVSWRLPIPAVTGGLKLQRGGSPIAQTIGADAWHAAGITGKGVRVGIVDLGFGGVKKLLGRELPANVKTNIPIDRMDRQQEDHGTAVAAVVHRVAPDAELYLAFEDNSARGFANVLQWLEDNKVQVVNYSVSQLIGPRDGSSYSAQLVELFMRRTGALWINSSGNYAQSHTLFKFNPGEKGIHFYSRDRNTLPFIAFAPATTVAMNWNGNWKGGEDTEYVFIVLDKNGNDVAVAAEQRRGQRNHFPFQIATFRTRPGEIYYLVVARTRGTTENIIDIIIPNSEIAPWAKVPQYSIAVPADSAGVLTVGATDLRGRQIEEYSSQGPTQDDRLKPDLSAPTNEVVAGYDKGFGGTSGAAPVAAGAAALVLQANPSLSNAQLKAFLMQSVIDLGDKGADIIYGTGRLMLPKPEQVNPDEGNVLGEGEGEGEIVLGEDEARAEVTEVKTQFNVKVRGVVGMSINTSFTLQNFTGSRLAVVALFTDLNGDALPPALEDYALFETIATGRLVEVRGRNNRFEGVSLFIPNAAFRNVTESRIQFFIAVYDVSRDDDAPLLGTSEPVTLRLRR
jgi:subtilisin family serine protease